jgi:hypothetical protein
MNPNALPDTPSVPRRVPWYRRHRPSAGGESRHMNLGACGIVSPVGGIESTGASVDHHAEDLTEQARMAVEKQPGHLVTASS